MQVTNETVLRVKNHKPKQFSLEAIVCFFFCFIVFVENVFGVVAFVRESSFNMTRGGGGEGNEDIETRGLKF